MYCFLFGVIKLFIKLCVFLIFSKKEFLIVEYFLVLNFCLI